MAITNHLYLPTLDHGASRPEAILYMAFQHTRFTRCCCYQQQPWALTPHFHPRLCQCLYQQSGSNFLWHFLVLPAQKPAVSRCVALCCPDFPTLLKAKLIAQLAVQQSYCLNRDLGRFYGFVRKWMQTKNL